MTPDRHLHAVPDANATDEGHKAQGIPAALEDKFTEAEAALEESAKARRVRDIKRAGDPLRKPPPGPYALVHTGPYRRMGRRKLPRTPHPLSMAALGATHQWRRGVNPGRRG